MQGLSGTYAFDDTDLTLPPTTGRWVTRNNYGIDGNGHPVYPALRSFELKWQLISTEDASQIIGFYNTVGNTGTVVACLPQWNNVGFEFINYSGCTLMEPEVGEYFQGFIQEVSLLVLNVRTN